jgi:COP9 signalosome complex subunit 4
MMEHNMHAAGKIYDNIHVSELGHLLKMSPQQAEKMAAKMINEGRLRASIDQVEGLLEFEEDNDPIKSWDERIEDVCTEVSNSVTTLQAS